MQCNAMVNNLLLLRIIIHSGCIASRNYYSLETYLTHHYLASQTVADSYTKRSSCKLFINIFAHKQQIKKILINKKKRNANTIQQKLKM